MSALADLEAQGTELTDEQAQEFEQADADFKKLDEKIRRAERVEKTKARLDEPRPSAGAMQVLGDSEPVTPAGPEAKTSFECFEEFLCAVDIARSGEGSDQRLDFHGVDLRGEQRFDDPPRGGFMVPPEFRMQLLQLDPAQTPLLGSVMRLPGGTNPDASVTLPVLEQDGNQHGGVTVQRYEEGDELSETDATIKQVSWTPTEIGAHIALTEKLLRNWSGAMGLAQNLLRGALNAALEAEVFDGKGGAQMLGILRSEAAIKIGRQKAGSVAIEDIANMAARKLNRGGAAFWLYNPLLLTQFMQMTDGNQNLVWQSSMVAGSPNQLWGLPAYPYEFAKEVGALGDLVLIQPNPYYVIKEGSGPYVDVGLSGNDFLTNRRRVKIFTLNDGAPWIKAPFKLANGTEVSPFVLLDHVTVS